MTNDLFTSVIGVFVATIATLYSGTPPLLNSAQVGAAASATSGGRCERAYQQCMGNPWQKNKQLCEQTWRTCVSRKCKIGSLSGGIKQCPKDPDCESSCIEFATSKYGLQNCCLIEPVHNESCRKLIDDTCNPSTPSSYILGAGPVYNEGDIIPPQRGTWYTDTDPNFDSKAVVSPSYPLNYPVGTSFSETGLPSNAPLPNSATPLQEFPPDSAAQQERQFNPSSFENRLPPEYQPDIPYETSLRINGERIPVQYNGVTYSLPAESVAPNPSSQPSEISGGLLARGDTFGPPTESSAVSPPASPFQQFLGRVQSFFRNLF